NTKWAREAAAEEITTLLVVPDPCHHPHPAINISTLFIRKYRPVTKWLGSEIINIAVDAITWWTGMEATGNPLARTALNFLSIPGMKFS
ncbi:hypothetical protein B0H10DRAFT_876000, partial [Mycena sp. CBHHK59/15]